VAAPALCPASLLLPCGSTHCSSSWPCSQTANRLLARATLDDKQCLKANSVQLLTHASLLTLPLWERNSQAKLAPSPPPIFNSFPNQHLRVCSACSSREAQPPWAAATQELPTAPREQTLVPQSAPVPLRQSAAWPGHQCLRLGLHELNVQR